MLSALRKTPLEPAQPNIHKWPEKVKKNSYTTKFTDDVEVINASANFDGFQNFNRLCALVIKFERDKCEVICNVKTRFNFLYEMMDWELITAIQGQYSKVIQLILLKYKLNTPKCHNF